MCSDNGDLAGRNKNDLLHQLHKGCFDGRLQVEKREMVERGGLTGKSQFAMSTLLLQILLCHFHDAYAQQFDLTRGNSVVEVVKE